ncbi:hypothetical protein FVF58_48905 [Paraburkholderia panacisoli]|uniref:Uncharacterized protein n=1 Tax=Paraburkholderia panacisoli TaxID=2603818 RepID=A0A5B0G6F5_9BURK|nr:hypothetical protein [Paraburkholderia panacisoli]KAA0997509.1 hypothetical protein FVF58_48905 [Paraburkholderia panacisoli]
MKLSEYIAKLQAILGRDGDLDVVKQNPVRRHGGWQRIIFKCADAMDSGQVQVSRQGVREIQ